MSTDCCDVIEVIQGNVTIIEVLDSPVVVEVIQPYVEVVEVLSGIPGLPGGPGEPGPPGEPGIKVYATKAELDAVREAEVGVWHIPNLNAEFGDLAGTYPNAFAGTGPAELLISSTVADRPEDSGIYGMMSRIVQSLDIAVDGTPYILHVSRTVVWNRVTGVFVAYDWIAESAIPSTNAPDMVPITDPAGGYPAPWITISATNIPTAGTLMRRDPDGRVQAAMPAADADLTPKQYVDESIAAIPPAGGGLKVYANLAEVEAVREAEVGVLHVDDFATAFPGQPSIYSGPADLVVTTSFSAGGNGYVNFAQHFRYTNSTSWDVIEMQRGFLLDSLGALSYDDRWVAVAYLPPPGGKAGAVAAVTGSAGSESWWVVYPTASASGDRIMKRDAAGRAQVVDPSVAADIATKGYVDGAITAAPVPPHTHPEIGGTHRFLLDATPPGDPGVGRVSVENAGGQVRLLRVSKTDADGGAVNLAVLAVNDSVALSAEGATPTIYARGYANTVVTDAGTHWEFTVTRESGVGALPADGTPLLLNVTLANGAGTSEEVPLADEVTPGIARYATQAEVDAGVEAASVVRPSTLAPYVTARIAAIPGIPPESDNNNNTHYGMNSGMYGGGNANAAVGQQALQVIFGSNNAAIGFNAGKEITYGSSNVAIGHGALYAAGGDAAAMTVNQHHHVGVGFQSGAAYPGTGDAMVAVGSYAQAHSLGVALGYNAKAQGVNSVAVGTNSVATEDNQVMLGTPSQHVVVNNDPVAPLEVSTKGYTDSRIWKGTQVEYDAIVTKDPTVLYVVVG